MSAKLPKLDEDTTSREHKRMHVRSRIKSNCRCTLCPPHRGENRSRTSRKRNAGQKPVRAPKRKAVRP